MPLQPAETDQPGLPLAGVRVVDATSLLPGPFASQLLADLGATVVKVERPGGDPMRRIGQGTYDAVNRGKPSIELDLKRAHDRDLFTALATDADVLIESNRPGVMERLGLGYEELTRLNPSLVYASLSGWGQGGPAAAEPGHNGTYLARAGTTYLTGENGGPPSDGMPVAVADLGGALYAVIAVLAALHAKPRRAHRLDISLYDSSLALMAPRFAEYVHKGYPSRDRLLRRPAHGVFEAGDGRHLAIAAVEDHFWVDLCRAIGRPDLGKRRDLRTYQARMERADEVDAAVTAALRNGSRDWWVTRLRDHDVPVGPVLAPEEVPADPQAQHLGRYQSWPDIRAFIPVTGLGTRSGWEVPGIDADADRIRRYGWAGLPDR